MEFEFDQSLMPQLNLGLSKLNLSLPPEAREKLLAHLFLLAKWNKAYNLTAINNQRDMLGLHVFDSLSIVSFIQGPKVLDVGSGAGFPGIPLAIALPEYEFVLLDSNRKKTTFLTHVALTLGLKNVKIVHSRVEDFHFDSGFDTIVTRATTSLKSFIATTQHLLRPTGILLAMKGKIPEAEIAEIDALTSVIKLIVPEVAAERHIIKLQLRN